MIVRLIFFIAISLICWWLYRQFIAFNHAKAPTKQKPKNQTSTQETMVRCTTCKTLTPRSHAIHDQDGREFCCKKHLQAFHKS